MNIEDLKISQYPEPQHGRGMSVPNMSKGIKVVHLPTGNTVICMHHRAQHKNKDAALAVIELLID
jgi:protein subunit release factor A